MMDNRTRLRRLSELYVQAQLIELSARSDHDAWVRSWRQREREQRRWGRFSDNDLFTPLRDALPDAEELARRGFDARGGRVRRLLKEAKPFKREEFADGLKAIVTDAGVAGAAVKTYVGTALDTGELAGQFTLDALGINKTFAWANPRNMARAVYEVRGSKIVQNAHGAHLDELTKIIERATDPTTPRTIGQVTKEIRERWDGLTRWQAERIARTETAAVYNTTAMNAMRANGVESFRSIVATGPSIGVTSGAVCPICVDFAANSPWPADSVPEWPPLHPSCRCVMVPAEDFLPPAEPWAGGDVFDGIYSTDDATPEL